MYIINNNKLSMLFALLSVTFVLPVGGFFSESLFPKARKSEKMAAEKISSAEFYEPFHGHDVELLESIVLPALRGASDSLIWCAGDSSLDNKYWFSDTADAPLGSGYARVLDPPLMKQDVTYWLNQVALEKRQLSVKDKKVSTQRRLAAINTAVEATTLQDRSTELVGGLLPQDKLIRDNISAEDILIVSIGANDVIENVSGTGDMSSFLDKLRSIFGLQVQEYIEKVVAKTIPAKILVCMIYFPDEAPTGSWANSALEILGYNSNPQELQNLIRDIYTESTSEIRIRGSSVDVIPVPLFQVLDGKNSNDYVQRVEPSPKGGRKLAELLLVSTKVKIDPVLLLNLTNNLFLPQDTIETTSSKGDCIKEL